MINKPTVLYTKFHNQPQPLLFTVYDLIMPHSFMEEDVQALNTVTALMVACSVQR